MIGGISSAERTIVKQCVDVGLAASNTEAESAEHLLDLQQSVRQIGWLTKNVCICIDGYVPIYIYIYSSICIIPANM